MTTSSNITWHAPKVSRQDRENLAKHKGAVLWFTGLSGSGKSTLANAVEDRLHQMNMRTYVLDGDNVRHGLCGDLGFSEADRSENIRRIAETSKLFVDAGIIVLTAFISPFRNDRQRASELLGSDYIEIYCNSPLEACEDRDVKGMYKKARAGEIKNLTGVSSPYEAPVDPEISLCTDSASINECVETVLSYLEFMGIIPNNKGIP